MCPGPTRGLGALRLPVVSAFQVPCHVSGHLCVLALLFQNQACFKTKHVLRLNFCVFPTEYFLKQINDFSSSEQRDNLPFNQLWRKVSCFGRLTMSRCLQCLTERLCHVQTYSSKGGTQSQLSLIFHQVSRLQSSLVLCPHRVVLFIPSCDSFTLCMKTNMMEILATLSKAALLPLSTNLISFILDFWNTWES